MRYRFRLHLATRVALLSIFLGTPAGANPQSSAAQANAALPKPWNDALTQLADKVAASQSPSIPITLDIKNISSLSASDSALIGSVFATALQRHSFKFASADSTGKSPAHLQLTLSESADGYVWIVQTNSDPHDVDSTMIASVPKPNLSESQSNGPFLSLEKRLVWQQPTKFLDFKLITDPPSGDPRLLVLGTNQIALYRTSDSRWQLASATPIPRSATRPRDLEGSITGSAFFIGEFECVTGPDPAASAVCKAPRIQKPNPDSSKNSGLPDTVRAVLQRNCDQKTMLLATSEGDWTQNDAIQGYLAGTLSVASPSGIALGFDGPVMSLEPDSDTNSARAVVHNLKTGNYEAYIVTATCSH